MVTPSMERERDDLNPYPNGSFSDAVLTSPKMVVAGVRMAEKGRAVHTATLGF